MTPETLIDEGPQLLLFTSLNLDPFIRVLSITRDQSRGHNISLYTQYVPENKKEAILSITIFHITQDEQLDYKIEFFKDQCLNEHHMGDPIKSLRFSLVKSGSETIGRVITENGYWAFIQADLQPIISQYCMKDVFKSIDIMKMKALKIRIGLERSYLDFTSNQSAVFDYDESHDKLVFKFGQTLDFSKESSMLRALTERFVRIHSEIFRDMNLTNGVLSLVHGQFVSITDFASTPYDERLRCQAQRQWVHLKSNKSQNQIRGRVNAGQQTHHKAWSFVSTERNIKSIHFMSITQSQCITYLLLSEDSESLKQAIYYPHLNKILQVSNVFTIPKGCKYDFSQSFIYREDSVSIIIEIQGIIQIILY